MFAAALVCSEYPDGNQPELAEMVLSTNIISLLLTQQMAAITATSATAAATAATS